jgi:hypothetical protein
MGVALYIALERQIPGLDALVDGKMLSKTEELHTRLATRLGVTPLMEFLSMNTAEASAFLDGAGVQEVDVAPEQWFAAEDGLKTVQAVLRSCPGLSVAREDLLQFERVLKEARGREVRWHLAVDN